MLWEAMVAEQRSSMLDRHARATFAKPGERVQDTRDFIAEYLPKPAPTETEREIQRIRSASHMRNAFADGFVELG